MLTVAGNLADVSVRVGNNIFWEGGGKWGDEEGCFAILSTCSSNPLQGKESRSANSCCSGGVEH